MFLWMQCVLLLNLNRKCISWCLFTSDGRKEQGMDHNLTFFFINRFNLYKKRNSFQHIWKLLYIKIQLKRAIIYVVQFFEAPILLWRTHQTVAMWMQLWLLGQFVSLGFKWVGAFHDYRPYCVFKARTLVILGLPLSKNLNQTEAALWTQRKCCLNHYSVVYHEILHALLSLYHSSQLL